MRLPKNVTWPDVPQQAGPVWAYLRAMTGTLAGVYGKIRAEIAAGKTGTLILDDGTNWRVTLTFTDGKLTAVTTAASSGAAANWSE